MTTPAPKPPQDDTTVYALGQTLVTFAVCAPATLDAAQVAAQAGLINPTGVGPWQYEGEPLEDGPNPRPCPDDPDGRRHWLLVC